MTTESAGSSNLVQRDLAGRRLGRYEVLTQLAQGGMAAVYVARAVGVAGFERLVAIKVLHPHLAHEDEFTTMFLDEARLAARIRHPNVVATLDISDSEGDGYFLVMEYVEGDHIGALLQRAAKGGERLPPGVTSRIINDALTGLSAAHRLTGDDGEPLMLVHRDVSPHNVLVGVDGIARLTDFGVAKAEVRLSSTREGQFKGKLAYMAPEQASNGTADQRSDLFSLGTVLWEALTGRRLFRGENNAETLNKLLKEPIAAPSSVWPELEPFDPVLDKALCRDPDERFQTADEFSDALETAAAQAGGLVGPRGVADVVRKHADQKLQEESRRIREAIRTLEQERDENAAASSSQEGLERASPTPSSASSNPPSESERASGQEVAQVSSATGQSSESPEPRRHLGRWIGGGVVVTLAAVAGTAFLLPDQRTETVPTTPAAAHEPGSAPRAVGSGGSEASGGEQGDDSSGSGTERSATANESGSLAARHDAGSSTGAALAQERDGGVRSSDDAGARDPSETEAPREGSRTRAQATDSREEPAADRDTSSGEPREATKRRSPRRRPQKRHADRKPRPTKKPASSKSKQDAGSGSDGLLINPYRR